MNPGAFPLSRHDIDDVDPPRSLADGSRQRADATVPRRTSSAGQVVGTGLARQRRLGPNPLGLYLTVASGQETRGERQPATTLSAFIDGLKAYWAEPRLRREPGGQLIWERGPVRLLSYGPGHGMPVLVVPSLVNRSYVLDLLPGRSLIGALATAGLQPMLLDWGEPGPQELDLGLADHLALHLEPALRVARQATCHRPVVLGYCMGGVLALALASRAQREIAGLALLATPWNFSSAQLPAPLVLPAAAASLGNIVATFGHVPANMLDWTFAVLDPLQVVEKYIAFGAGDRRSERSRVFVAIEDWLADGVALAGPVACECLLDWYIANRTMAGIWRVEGRRVRPEELDLPAFVAIPTRDRIVPEEVARPLARLLPQATVVEPAAGHVGMIVGSRAPEILWRPLTRWLGRIARATV